SATRGERATRRGGRATGTPSRRVAESPSRCDGRWRLRHRGGRGVSHREPGEGRGDRERLDLLFPCPRRARDVEAIDAHELLTPLERLEEHEDSENVRFAADLHAKSAHAF